MSAAFAAAWLSARSRRFQAMSASAANASAARMPNVARYHDPRTGETVYRLANIRRDEPSAELFKVPEDYKVKGGGRG